jgi:hypothetical protein
MEKDNNFKKVFEREAPEGLKDSSLKNAQGSVHTVRSFFDILDLYISKFFGAIIHSFKDSSSMNYGVGTGIGLDTVNDVEDEGNELEIEEENNEEEDWNNDSDLPKDL